MQTRLKEVGGLTALKGAPTTQELSILKSDLFVGEDLLPEDITIRRMLLCHDQYDRTFERFPSKMLRRLSDTIPGRSVLPAHDTGGWLGGGSLPLARFFTGQLETRQEKAFPILENPPADNRRTRRSSVGDAAPPGFVEEDANVQWLVAGFYFPAHESTEALRVHLDTGVYKWVSIGFRYSDITCDICGNSYLDYEKCSHWLGRMDDPSGKLCTGTYSGDMEKVETMEGSFVYLGGQQRARNIKSMIETGQVNPQAMAATPYGDDLVALKEGEFLARKYGHTNKIYQLGELQRAELQEALDGQDELADLHGKAAPVGRSLADQAQEVVASVEALVQRVAAVRSMRTAKGRRRPISDEVMDTVLDIRDALLPILPSDEKEFHTVASLQKDGADAPAQMDAEVDDAAAAEVEQPVSELEADAQLALRVQAMAMAAEANALALQIA